MKWMLICGIILGIGTFALEKYMRTISNTPTLKKSTQKYKLSEKQKCILYGSYDNVHWVPLDTFYLTPYIGTPQTKSSIYRDAYITGSSMSLVLSQAGITGARYSSKIYKGLSIDSSTYFQKSK